MSDIAHLQVRVVESSLVISSLPNPQMSEPRKGIESDLLIMCLGFEERGRLALARAAAEGYRTQQVAMIVYEGDIEANERQRTGVVESLEGWGAARITEVADDDGLTAMLSRVVSDLGDGARVIFDLTCASNRVVCRVLDVLLRSKLRVRLLYGEAASYFPAEEDYKNVRTDPSLTALSTGTQDLVMQVTQSGEQDDSGGDVVVIVPGFSQDRARKVINFVDSSLLLRRDSEKIFWLLGVPHHEKNSWRTDLLRLTHGIDGVPQKCVRLVSTFDYKAVWHELEDIYESLGNRVRMNVAPMGSKLQAVGCSLFFLSKPDVRVVFANPKSYYTEHYSSGLSELWFLELGECSGIAEAVWRIGELEVALGGEVLLSGHRRVDWD